MTILPKTLMLLGSGELGKELAIAAKRIGCKVIACDRYYGAPAMQVADTYEVLEMTIDKELQKVIRKHKPDVVIPEIEALAVKALAEIEREGIQIIPTARATEITMNRDKVRNLAESKLGLRTARYAYASTIDELRKVTPSIGLPVVIKPIMSSSGKGQSLVKEEKELANAWEVAIKGARGISEKVIVEEFIDFETEITLLTIRQKDGSTIFCPPIGHEQVNGDYQRSWQPADIRVKDIKKAQEMAKKITDNLGGVGLFGVEFFITKTDVIFSELSPRPHDTGLVTLISQNLSEFELHLRAILGLPIPKIICKSPGASKVILAGSEIIKVGYTGIDNSLKDDGVKVLIFGKPTAKKGRRMGVALAKSTSIKEALLKAEKTSESIKVIELNKE